MDLQDIKVLLDSQERILRSEFDKVVKQLQERIDKTENTIQEVIKSPDFFQAEMLDL